MQELRARKDRDQELDDQVEKDGRQAGRLAERLVEQVDPDVTLESEGSAPEDFASEVLSRLAGRSPASTRYRLKGEVAHGGMGAVLRVWDEDLRRHLAMKVMLGRGAPAGRGDTPPADPRLLMRFLEEAQVTGQLDHPGIVPVHELGLDPDGRVYFTMKLVKGSTLKDVFDELARGQGPWTQTRVLGLILKVCEAMSYAHAKGVIHRDLKPANVMVGRFGEVYVMDWGLARILGRADPRNIAIRLASRLSTADVLSDRRDRGGETPDSPLYTMDGDVVGTPAYMPPEQARGDLEAMGPHSDVYAVGAMLYHLLAGQMPYVPPDARLNNYAIWHRVQEGPPRPVGELAPQAPGEIVAVCERAMAREPAARYADMTELAEDLRAYLENKVVRAYERGALAEARKWMRRNPAAAALAAALPLIACLGTYVASTRDEVRAAEAQAVRARIEEHLERGYLELGEGNLDEARAAFMGALERDPALVEAAAGLILVYLEDRSPERALNALEEYPEAARSPQLAPLRADALRESGREEEARALDALQISPTGPVGLFIEGSRLMRDCESEDPAMLRQAQSLFERAILGSAHARALYFYEYAHASGHLGDSEAAEKVVAALELQWPQAARAATWREFALSKLDYSRSIAAGREAVALAPEDSNTHYKLGATLRQAGQAQEAIPHLREAIRLLPGFAPAHLELGLALETTGGTSAALASLQEAIRLEPESHKAHNALGSLRFRAGAFADALESFSQAARLSPDSAIYSGNAARAAWSLGDLESAVEGFRRTVRLAPEDGVAHRSLAACLLQLERGEEAREACRIAVQVNPSDAGIHYSYGGVLQQTGDPAGAAAEFREALRLDPDFPGALAELGNVLDELGDEQGASEALNKALEITEDPVALFNLGTIQWNRAELDQAIAAFQRAIAAKPDFAEANCNLGHALRDAGRYPEALAAMRRGHELGSARPDWTYPSQEWVARCQRLVDTGERMSRILQGDPVPETASELIDLAEYCYGTKDYEHSVQLYQRALELEPELGLLIDPLHRYNAACSAALAATNSGEASMRRRALEWLWAELATRESLWSTGKLSGRHLAEDLRHWKVDQDLAVVRDDEALGMLDPGEREDLQAFWAAVDDLLGQL